MGHLEEHIAAHVQWKHDLHTQLTRYRSWLRRNMQLSSQIDDKLKLFIEQLTAENITLTLIGEKASGKTELINALLFSEIGKRVIPVGLDRSTFCPTEFFFDIDCEQPYIKLLPIDTRLDPETIESLKDDPHQWHRLPLPLNDENALAGTLSELSRTISVSHKQAKELGFEPGLTSSKPGLESIPAWRYAMINLDHPLLRNGLRIIDTPALNTHNLEPELAHNILAKSSTILFLLSADGCMDTGKLQSWRDYLGSALVNDSLSRIYAVINKIDMLWDDPQGEGFVRHSIEHICTQTAAQLGITSDQVSYLSAKQAVRAQSVESQELLKKSNLNALEGILSNHLLLHQEGLVNKRVISGLLEIVQNSRQIIQQRLEELQLQREQLMCSPVEQQHLINKLRQQAQVDYDHHRRQLQILKSGRLLINKQVQKLQEMAQVELFQSQVVKVRQELTRSLTTIGMSRAINRFFSRLHFGFEQVQQELSEINATVASLYKRVSHKLQVQQLTVPTLELNESLRKLQAIEAKSEQFYRNARTLLTPQDHVIEQFFSTLVVDIQHWQQQLQTQLARFNEAPLLPLVHALLQNKKLLEQQLAHLKQLQQQDRDRDWRLEKVDQFMQEIEYQQAEADSIIKMIRRPSPLMRTQKVIPLPGAPNVA